jgi:hypothetical protein
MIRSVLTTINVNGQEVQHGETICYFEFLKINTGYRVEPENDDGSRPSLSFSPTFPLSLYRSEGNITMKHIYSTPNACWPISGYLSPLTLTLVATIVHILVSHQPPVRF